MRHAESERKSPVFAFTRVDVCARRTSRDATVESPSPFNLAEAARLALGLHQSENVTLPDRALHVAHNLAVLVVEKLHAHLGHLRGNSASGWDEP